MNLFDDNGNLMRSESSDGKVVTRNYNGFNWQTDYVSADVSLERQGTVLCLEIWWHM